MKTPFETAWRAFEEHDRTRQAPAHLEARVLSAVTRAQVASRQPSRMRAVVWIGAGAAATIAVAIVTSLRLQPHEPPAVISARPPQVAMLPPTVEPVRPRIERQTSAPPKDDRLVLVMLDTTPPLPGEPLQLVRLRVPKEALLGLGMALFDHDEGGMVDVDVLVGEDGLPRDVRRVRLALEDRR